MSLARPVGTSSTFSRHQSKRHNFLSKKFIMFVVSFPEFRQLSSNRTMRCWQLTTAWTIQIVSSSSIMKRSTTCAEQTWKSAVPPTLIWIESLARSSRVVLLLCASRERRTLTWQSFKLILCLIQEFTFPCARMRHSFPLTKALSPIYRLCRLHIRVFIRTLSLLNAIQGKENTFVAVCFIAETWSRRKSIAPFVRSNARKRFGSSNGHQRRSKLESITNRQLACLAATSVPWTEPFVCCQISESTLATVLSVINNNISTFLCCFHQNSSSIRCAWERVYNKYCRLYSRSAFVHHFENEGIEKSDMEDASENVLALIKDYEEVEKD